MPLDLSVLRQLSAQVKAEAPVVDGTPVADHRGGLWQYAHYYDPDTA